MKKAYLLVYSETLGTREEVKAVLNRLPEVITWRHDLPQSFYIVSEADAKTLARLIREACGERGRFIVTEIGSNKWGWLTRKSWRLFRKKE